jgi:hypothetical protein
MAKIILKDGTEEFLSPGAAQAKVAAGEAVWAQCVPMYSTRQLVAEPVNAEPVNAEPVKKRRKRKPKPVEEVVEVIPEEPAAEPQQVEADEVD